MTDDTELASPEDRRYAEGLLDGLDLAHSIALLLDDGGAGAERVAELIRDTSRLVTRMRRQHGVPPQTIDVVLH